jgi:c-di-GMP-related signal transduction protein
MKQLETILDMWSKDCIIDDMKLDDVSRNTPMLHAKYLQLHSQAKMELQKAEFKQKSLLKDKWLYYNGKMSQEQIENKGWDFDPFDGLKVLKGEMDHYYNSDIDIQKSEQLVEYWKNIISTLSEIIEQLKWRHQTIKNIIEWKRFQSGS